MEISFWQGTGAEAQRFLNARSKIEDIKARSKNGKNAAARWRATTRLHYGSVFRNR